MNARRISELAEMEFKTWKLNPEIWNGRPWGVDASVRTILHKEKVPHIQLRSTFNKIWAEIELLWYESIQGVEQ